MATYNIKSCAQQLNFFCVPALFWRTRAVSIVVALIIPHSRREKTPRQKRPTCYWRGWLGGLTVCFNAESFRRVWSIWTSAEAAGRSLWSDLFVINQSVRDVTGLRPTVWKAWGGRNALEGLAGLRICIPNYQIGIAITLPVERISRSGDAFRIWRVF